MESFLDVFNAAMEYCKREISPTIFNAWFVHIKPVGIDGEEIVLSVDSEVSYNVVHQPTFYSIIKKAFASVMGFEMKVRIDCEYPAENHQNNEAKKAQPAADNQGEYEYTFATYIVGSSNKFAHAASMAVAAKPAGSYNPLFIHGNSGLGKTHLMYAIVNEISEKYPDLNICYIKGEDFTNELIEAIGNDTRSEFRNKYRKADVLLVDDIQFIGGRESTQEEFFHTFNSLYEAKKQIVLASDRPPKEIRTLEDRLRTRFESGLIADIQPPDFETRIAIVRRKAELLGFDIPDDVAEYIASRLKTNIRQLEGVVKKLMAFRSLTGTAPSITIAQKTIRDILSDSQPVPITVEKIILEVSRNFNVSQDDIRSQKRVATVSVARQTAMYVIREITQMSMSSIGEEFSNRDHSTVVYAIQEVERKMEIDPSYRELIKDIIRNINGN
ncbi:MAG: chromosomal replication initiator protein DnaA [Oscillospiraceae bacterium]|nr:chromosomal replication initiator protein DnaA [Oscillospiraceae bacterium]MBQ3048998.1 chromosomal replication initiator protein DnaA [Oscillospiraceae bacterium]MBQ9938836.1 chromosomal replication initiator protein DnaA [Oscillospiraceae bacterium]